VDRYTTKRRLLRPVTALRRRRAGQLNPYTRVIYEAHDYRPAMRRFVEATRREPDILYAVDLLDGAIVLDVGAYIGDWTTRFLERADEHGVLDLRLHAFEPEPSSAALLRDGIGADPRVEVHAFGMGGQDRIDRLTISGPGSSVHGDPAAPGALGATEIEVRDADAVLRSLGVEHVDLIKINIEGCEFELLDRLHETGWLRRIGTVIVQFHEFAPDAYRARRRNRRWLSETHDCTWSYTWVNERWDPKDRRAPQPDSQPQRSR
jgi:FkbM family methyltransferase